MDIEKAIKICQNEIANTYAENKAIAIATILSELDKKDEQIRLLKQTMELMTDYIVEPYNVRLNIARKSRRQAVIEYFTKKAEDN